ncbi:MAG: exo-alpha-sialidase [Planctomycetes bacterium]|nr:exo-alpha-sialidase [Planctomycetota bacterium]
MIFPEINTLLSEATVDHPRQSEASIAVLADGRLLAAWSDFYGGVWGDNGPARIVGRWSEDQGVTWSDTFTLQENIGRINCMSASLLVLPSGRILLAFGRKDREDELLHGMVKWSDDAGRTWSEPRDITRGEAYWCHTNDRLVRLASGRILYPMSEDSRVGCHVWLSDDDGRSWRPSESGIVPPAGVAYEEPTVVEMPDGRLAMFIRTDTGNVHTALSDDGGLTWRPWKTHAPDMCGHKDCGPNAARSPSMVKRVPGTGDLLLVWNNNHVRTPLVAAVSRDNAETWGPPRTIEPMDGWPPRLTHAYPSLAFQDDCVHLTYWETHAHEQAERLIHLRYRRLPVEWFYQHA